LNDFIDVKPSLFFYFYFFVFFSVLVRKKSI